MVTKISVITITYNAESLLEQTINSILKQTYSNVEFIVIDGNSTDDTLSIIKKYEKYITYWCSENDSGMYHAMNKGINVASGQWINFMNAGDIFESKDTLSNIFIKSIIPSETKVLYGNTILVHKENKRESQQKAKSLKKLLRAEMAFTHQSAFVKTDALKKYQFNQDYKLAADYDLFLRMHINKEVFHYLENTFVSKFLLGGIHSDNMDIYLSEAINSLVRCHPQPKMLTNDNAFLDILSRYTIQNDIFFCNSLEHLYEQVETINNSYSNVIIYGYGSIGKFFEKFLTCEVVAIVDKNLSKDINKKIININELNNYHYDIIIITVLGKLQIIKQDLIQNKITNIHNFPVII